MILLFFLYDLPIIHNSDVTPTQWFPQITPFKICKRVYVSVSPCTYLLSPPGHTNSFLYLPT